uniref:Uncharacterized protein n=1 Tax=Rhizophagus irregularis (strain DAOM 181602 / DAOM 197198 / MUCL 43194) TaxID=747089 RepID=U9T5X7_RHIID
MGYEVASCPEFHPNFGSVATNKNSTNSAFDNHLYAISPSKKELWDHRKNDEEE